MKGKVVLINKIILFIVLFVFPSLTAQDVTISFGEIDHENNILPILYENNVEIGGFLIEISGLILEDTFGGASENYGFAVSNSSGGNILGFMFAATIPPGSGVLVNATFSEIVLNEICFTGITISGGWGNELEAVTGPCIFSGVCFFPGDFNNDSIIDILDIVLTVNCILAGDSCPCTDLDGNGEINILDVILIADIILGV